MVVGPPDSLENGQFDIFDPGPRTAGVDEFGLVDPDDRLGQGIVVGVYATADARLHPGECETLGVLKT